jgi:hypothetical protein
MSGASSRPRAWKELHDSRPLKVLSSEVADPDMPNGLHVTGGADTVISVDQPATTYRHLPRTR